MRDRDRLPMLGHDGPVPPAALAAARWGPGAWERLARGADAALLEARLRDCVAALARLRLSLVPERAVDRLVGMVARYRSAAAMICRSRNPLSR
jgi:hypothetical protein